MSPNLRFEFPATWPAPILATASPRVPLNAPRPGWGEGVTFAARRGREVAHSQATKISKPNRFAYPFRSRPRGVSRPLWLNSPEHQTSSYRDTANLGVGVRARGSRPCRNIIRVYIPRAPLSGPYSYTSLPLTLLYSLIHIVPVLAPGITRGVTSAKLTHTQSGSGVILRGNLF